MGAFDHVLDFLINTWPKDGITGMEADFCQCLDSLHVELRGSSSGDMAR